MKVRIKSDGTAKGTSVYDENGIKLTNIISIEWSISLDVPFGLAIIKTRAPADAMEVVTEAEISEVDVPDSTIEAPPMDVISHGAKPSKTHINITPDKD